MTESSLVSQAGALNATHLHSEALPTVAAGHSSPNLLPTTSTRCCQCSLHAWQALVHRDPGRQTPCRCDSLSGRFCCFAKARQEVAQQASTEASAEFLQR